METFCQARGGGGGRTAETKKTTGHTYRKPAVPAAERAAEGGGGGDLGGVFALRAHCALLLDYVLPEEPPSTPLGNALRIK